MLRVGWRAVCTVWSRLLDWVKSNLLHTVHIACHPTLQHHNSYNRTENHRQWNAVWPPDDGHKDARNMLTNNWLPINYYLLHPVGLIFIYLSKMHGHSNTKFNIKYIWSKGRVSTEGLSLYLFIRVIKRTVLISEAHHCFEPYTKLYPTFFPPG